MKIKDRLVTMNIGMAVLIMSAPKTLNAQISGNYDYLAIISKIQQEVQNLLNEEQVTLRGFPARPSAAEIQGWVDAQNPNGSWTGLDYGVSTSKATDEYIHLQRIRAIAAAATKSGNTKYNDNVYKNSVKQGLSFWHTSRTRSKNWWPQEIFYPQSLGEIMILMRKFPGFLPSVSTKNEIDEIDLLELFVPSGTPTATNPAGLTRRRTGANMLDIALHYIYRGVLTQNEAVLSGTTAAIDANFGDNVKVDHSYHDHGPQLQISSYGAAFSRAFMKIAYYLKGSPAEFKTNSTNFTRLLDFTRLVQVPALRGQFWDFSVLGRSISRKNVLKATIAPQYRQQKVIDPVNAFYYGSAFDRISGRTAPSTHVPIFNRHYWKSDYTQHSQPGYLFTVRNVSTRTIESETGNGESLKAHYLSYGATNITVNGDEYFNIMPVWDWAMIPGVTSKYTATFPARAPWGAYFGTRSFVGGVSNGVQGASVLDLNKDGVTGKKSWFFFDKEVVALGAGISSRSAYEVRTTVNQSRADGNAYVTFGSSTTETPHPLSTSTHSYMHANWIRHDGIAYFFPNNGNLELRHGRQIGNWYDINTNQPNGTVTEDVFKLWFNHGVDPSNASYSYKVVPNIASFAEASAYNQNRIVILSNTSALQAVRDIVDDVVAAIFHQAGALSFGSNSLKVDRSCALLFNESTSTLTISSPSQSSEAVGVTLFVNGTAESRFVLMPLGEMAGSSVSSGRKGLAEYIHPASEDAYVCNGRHVGDNFGSKDHIAVKDGDDTGYSCESFIKFELPSIPDSVRVDSIKLRLNPLRKGSWHAAIAYQLNHVRHDEWAEDTITWSSRPDETEVLGYAVGSASAMEWDMTSRFEEEISGDGILSLNVRSLDDDTQGWVTFVSKEGAGNLGPVLVIRYSST